MKKTVSILLIMILCCLPFQGCSKNDNEITAADKGTSQSDDNNEAIIKEYGDIFAMTQEERLEDYNYLWDTLKESYGYWGVLERAGIDTEEIYIEYLEYLKENPHDVGYVIAINSMLLRMGQAGHLSLIEPDLYEALKTAYSGEMERQVWDRALNQDISNKNYVKFSKMLKAFDENDEESFSSDYEEGKNIEYFILPGGQVAYLRILSFDMTTYESDKKEIYQFYKDAANCSDLIIDITENSGGGESYWEDILVAPNINKKAESKQYAMLAYSKNNAPYIDEAFTKDELKPIAELPQMNVNPKDKANATHYVEVVHSVEPSPIEDAFRGKLWVLTSPAVYSSSESFAIFCKETGFAKLVGTGTSGDGIGIDPAYVTLPHSGIMVRYSILVGLNHDGSINEEEGTFPDIAVGSERQALAAALKEIAH